MLLIYPREESIRPVVERESKTREEDEMCVILRRACKYEIGIFREGRRVVKKQGRGIESGVRPGSVN